MSVRDEEEEAASVDSLFCHCGCESEMCLQLDGDTERGLFSNVEETQAGPCLLAPHHRCRKGKGPAGGCSSAR